jgi:hypothetical protein
MYFKHFLEAGTLALSIPYSNPKLLQLSEALHQGGDIVHLLNKCLEEYGLVLITCTYHGLAYEIELRHLGREGK